MQKNLLRAGLSGLVAVVLTSGVLGQTVDSPRYSIRIENDKVVELSADGRKIPADSFYVYDSVIRKLRAKAEKDLYQARLGKAELAKEQTVRDRIGVDRDKERTDRDKEQAQQDMQRAQQDMQQSKRDLEQAMLEREKAERDRKLAAEDMEAIQRMIEEMVKDGLAPDAQSIVSITLDQDEFLLNGKKQPDAVHKKYATRFLVRPGYKILYHHDR